MDHPIPLEPTSGILQRPEHPLLTQLRDALRGYDDGGPDPRMNAIVLRGAVLLLAEAMQASDPAPFGSKAAAMNNPDSCWRKAELTEPVFILRAKDPLAPAVVRLWGSLAATTNVHEKGKISSAYNLAHAMNAWRESQELPSLVVRNVSAGLSE